MGMTNFMKNKMTNARQITLGLAFMGGATGLSHCYAADCTSGIVAEYSNYTTTLKHAYQDCENQGAGKQRRGAVRDPLLNMIDQETRDPRVTNRVDKAQVNSVTSSAESISGLIDRETSSEHRQRDERDKLRQYNEDTLLWNARKLNPHLNPNNPEDTPDKWQKDSFKVTCGGSNRLFLSTSATAFVANTKGNPSCTGKFLHISNASRKYPIYYGLSGVLNKVVPPSETVVEELSIFRGKGDNRPTVVDLFVKFHKE
jgi:hypothetical protein